VGEILGPYLRDYLQRDHRFQDGLGISVTSSGRCISFAASTTSGANGPTLLPKKRLPFVTFGVAFEQELDLDARD